MLIISENELLHTDSCQDIIEHHGVKGMKWGQRMKRWGAAAGRTAINSVRHPILSDMSISASRKHSRMGTDFGTTRSLEFRNRYIKDMVAAKKQYKKDKKQANTKYSDGVGKISKKYENSAFKELGKEYSKLGAERKNSIKQAKAKRKQAYAMAGGRY